MKTWANSAMTAVLLVAAAAPAITNRATAEDLRDALPPDVFLAVYGKHNSERDYQREHYAEVWNAVEETRIIEKTFQLIQARMAENDVGKMLAFRDTVKEALEPVQWKKLLELEEIIYGQKLDGPVGHSIVIARFPDDGAASLKQGLGNLFAMADEAGKDNINLVEETHANATLLTLQLPPQVPMSPVIGVRGDLFIFSTRTDFAKQALTLLDDPSAESKFDDPRVKKALSQLPEAEDALVFFDGKTLAQQLDGVIAFIRGVGAGNDEALRIATLIDSLLDELLIVDHEVTVEYTEGYQNRSATYGEAVSGHKNMVVGGMIANQKLFSDWSKWVPAEASSFSLNTGATVTPLYDWITTKIPEIFPESEQAFAKWDQIQDQFDVHLREDILQSFSGESVSIAMPGPPTPLGPSSKSVSFTRCSQPDRVKELIHRAFDALQEIPQVQAQGITLEESEQLEGFEVIRANLLMMMGGLTPVFGFQDGWMAMGSHVDAVQTVLDTRAGEHDSFAGTDQFAKFGLEVSGDVNAISYSNIGQSIRQAGQAMQQFGSMLPMIMAMAGQGGQGGPDLGPLQDVLQLLPPIGRIVSKFDFIESRLSVTQPGQNENSYVRHTVILIKPPAAAEAEAESAN
ncbi:hypothetical protein [Fuerstiella marisgermanici]|nr:hypothetical protein [Fuerstiella marisgermanici]